MIITQPAISRANASGFADTGNFSIKASSKAFKILSDKLYKFKIEAIIRELSTNAVDAHFDAKQTRPFEIWLPTHLDNVFKIRDYGVGLSHDNVMRLYTTYFESTKDSSNDYNGALGLGSKAPFSYVNTFNVVSYFNGKKSLYTAYISDLDTPSILFAGSEDTSEPNGLEISFPVDHDVAAFQRAAMKILYWFGENRPIVHGFSQFQKDMVERDSHILEIGSNWRIYKNSFLNGAHILQSNVCYPIDKSLMGALTSSQQEILTKAIVIEVPNGSVNFAPSREELDYDKNTVTNIKKIVDGIHKEISQKISDEIKIATTSWQRAVVFHEKFAYGKPLHLSTASAEFWNGNISTYFKSRVYVFNCENVRPSLRFDNSSLVKENDKYVEVVKNEKIHIKPSKNVKFFTYNTLGGVTAFQSIRKNLEESSDHYHIFICGDKSETINKVVESFGSPKVKNLDNIIPKASKKISTAYEWDISKRPAPSNRNNSFSKINAQRIFDDIENLSGYYHIVNNFSDFNQVDDFPDVRSVRQAFFGYYNDTLIVPYLVSTKLYLFRKADQDTVLANPNLKPWLAETGKKITNTKFSIDPMQEAYASMGWDVLGIYKTVTSLDVSQIINSVTRQKVIEINKAFTENDKQQTNVRNQIHKLNSYIESINKLTPSLKLKPISLDNNIDEKIREINTKIKNFGNRYPSASTIFTNNRTDLINYINGIDFLIEYKKNLTETKTLTKAA